MKEEENRPNPEELLKAIQHEENTAFRGKLKIFLGMAAGVGKTYAMLEEAKTLTKANVDVVIGIIDTHERIETKALLEGLKAIPEKKIEYRNKIFSELDLDEIIRRKPFIVLVDELAHSNIPGMRHEKRWQDVMEILDNGINVYTTLNVQHIESLKDIVEDITGIEVKETVPDIIIEQASSIKIIDLNPDELLKRLQEGKVYLQDQSKIATLNFFKGNKLTALREILLRYTAEKIDYDLHKMITTEESEKQWKPREKLLVAIGPSPHSQKLIRTTRRLAFNLEAPWIAVYVDTGKMLDDSSQIMLSKNLNLARDLGAEVITTHDPNIADAIQRIAKRRGVTQIIVGRSPPSKYFSFFDRFSLLDQLARECKEIDIHVIRQETQLTTSQKKLKGSSYPPQYLSYFLVFVYVTILTCLNLAGLHLIGYRVVAEIFFIGILVLSLFFQKGPIFFATALFSFILFLFIIPEESKFSAETYLLFLIYFLTAIATGILVDRYRKHEELLAKREATSQALYRIIRQIGSSLPLDKMLHEVTERLGQEFNSEFEIVIKKIGNGLDFPKTSKLMTTEKEKATATWVFENEEEAGWSTDTLPLSENLYIPIKSTKEILGILIYKKKPNKIVSLDEKNFLHTVCQQLYNPIERSFNEEKTKQNELRIQIEKINKVILNRIMSEFKPSLQEAKNSVSNFKRELEVLNNKILLSKFKGIELACEHFSKVFDHLSMISEKTKI